MSFSTEMIFRFGCCSSTPLVIISAIVRKAGTGSTTPSPIWLAPTCAPPWAGGVGDGDEPFGGVGRVLRRPIVVGAVGVALKLLVRVAEQRHAVAAVEDLHAEAVQVHVLQPLRRVPASRPAGGGGGGSQLGHLLPRPAGG